MVMAEPHHTEAFKAAMERDKQKAAISGGDDGSGSEERRKLTSSEKKSDPNPKAKAIKYRQRSTSFNVRFQSLAKVSSDILDDGLEDGLFIPAKAKKVVTALCQMLDDPHFSTMVRGVLLDTAKGGIGGGYMVHYDTLRNAMRAHIRKEYAKDAVKMKALLAKIPN
jgi:hypothetical protein